MTVPRPRLLTVGEAARALRMCRTTLLAAEESGLLVPVRTPGGHRRYDPADLDRFLGRTHTPAPPPLAAAAPDAVHLGPAVRAAMRPLVQALEADAAGVYLAGDEGLLRFGGAFGVPRWLAERLADAPAPEELVRAHANRRYRLFDPADAAFPEPRSTGHAVAVPLCADDERSVGALFVVTRSERGLPPAELRIVEAFGRIVASLVAAQLRVADLERRLARIAAVAAGS
ncbi:MerR family transcriptional regulator [Pseudonocardia broussonetiae]|uniref:MerR family transcriptional regulator n=1 Tax=Pseudonocardia broussonetiae TaxID=2736640 RepID=A0A6M6JEX8_9PSEU|nr:helix-turn-helix domain-containing protein [Pseudonocardia broussonetiae]QJY46146.1 MerR family transcriptional regulator [Pseudonocardia broussonetiae]